MRAALPLPLLALAGVVALSCDHAGSSLAGANADAAAPAGRTIDMGGGVVATLGVDGSFSIASGGATLLATPPGVALFSRTADPDDPDGWHDPTQPHADLTTTPIDATSVQADAVGDASSTRALHLVVPAQPDDTALLSLSLAADGSFVTGLGEQFAHVSASGHVTPLFLTLSGAWESGTNEAHVPVPLLVSSAGWGVFVASREAGAFDVGATDASTVRATFEGRTLDVWFFVDPDPLAVVARFARLAGLPRRLPRWALSLIHWRHWASADDAISIATQYRQRHIPTSALWFDDGWQTGVDTFATAPSVVGDAQATMAELAALGYRVMAWSAPYLQPPGASPATEAEQLYAQAQQGGWLVQDGSGHPYATLAGPGASGYGVVDFTSAGARGFWEGLVARATRSGIVGFKCDYGEDFIPNILGQRDVIAFADGTTSRTARLFPLEEHATYHAVLDEAFPGDGALIVRASTWGGAQQADIVWPGDLDPGFEHQGDALPGGGVAVGGLPAVVVAAQTLAASGFPAFGSDTAGYRHDPTRESTLRWMEHTALSVVMQVYEDGSRLPWSYDDAAGAEYQAMATLHQQLEPYNAVLMNAAQSAGTPPIRALPLAYPGDRAGWAHADEEYLLGPDLLVAPVLQAGATSANVHLPPGTWVHWWSDHVYAGPADVTVDAPLGSPPLFARAGGLVPMLPAGIDTLVPATAPGVVSLSTQGAEMRARAWPSGTSAVTLDDGALVKVADDGTAVGLTWQPGQTAQNLVADVDLRTSAEGAGQAIAVDTLSGSQVVPVSDSSAVQASAVSAWAFDAASGHAWLRLVGAGAVKLRPSS